MSNQLYVPLVGFVALQLVLLTVTGAQVINLRHPETGALISGRHSQVASPNPAVRPAAHRSKFTARPGNVIVHFDRNHDIQRLQYVLQDGRLATLYSRNQHHPANGGVPIQVHRRDEPAGAPPPAAGLAPIVSPTPPSNIDHDQTINIVDAKMRDVSQLVGGDHLTVELPNKVNNRETGQSGSGHSAPVPAANQEHAELDEKLQILATVAADALQAAGGESKMKQAGALLDLLKVKVSHKLRELPAIMEAKLGPKSYAVGQVFLDEAGRKLTLVEATGDSVPTFAPKQSGGGGESKETQRSFLMHATHQPIVVSLEPELSRQQLVN